jgi:hypothetical protein
MLGSMPGSYATRLTAMVVKKRKALLRSRLPFLKKKLTPSCPRLEKV